MRSTIWMEQIRWGEAMSGGLRTGCMMMDTKGKSVMQDTTASQQPECCGCWSMTASGSSRIWFPCWLDAMMQAYT